VASTIYKVYRLLSSALYIHLMVMIGMSFGLVIVVPKVVLGIITTTSHTMILQSFRTPYVPKARYMVEYWMTQPSRFRAHLHV